MNRPILPETSWYIQRTRQKHDPLHDLYDVVDHRSIATCGVVAAEVGRGLRHPHTLLRYKAAWKKMRWIPSSVAVWERTLQIAWSLDRKGTPLPIQDIHIAACAMEISAVVLTYDAHFKQIPGLTVTDCLY